MKNDNKTKNIDTKVLDLFNKVKEKSKKIAANERVNWLTNCSFGFSPNGVHDRVNLQVVSDLNELINIYGFLVIKANSYELAADELGVKQTGKWLGYSFDNWKSDVKTRVNLLQLNNERKELKVLEERLNSLITVEQRREMELAEIEKLVN